MKCSRCGTESADDSTYCSECGAIMNAPPLPPLAAEEPPEPAAAPSETPYPPIFGPPRPPHREKAPVRSLDLAELLFLISGLMLLAAGFQNLGAGVAGLPVQYLLLGIVATLFGLVQTALVVMPGMMSDLERSSGTMMVVTALLFLIWGMAAAFGTNVGAFGGVVVAAGLATSLGLMLREGMIR
ncbi:hypothetical protein AOA80_06700 [Methanomassiliicoccales archaeon RumEn M1]|jgi:hypothetical protein|nr:hypothetical protein AOA80_06700 [Methanomassiliicoccales archaeon RumEn M1]